MSRVRAEVRRGDFDEFARAESANEPALVLKDMASDYRQQ